MDKVPEHILNTAYEHMKRAGIKDKRRVKFLIQDHVMLIETLGGKVIWPEEKKQEESKET